MYSLPQLFGARDLCVPVHLEEIEVCDTECAFKGEYPCDVDVFELCSILMTERGFSIPWDSDEGLRLYHFLRTIIQRQL